MELKVRVLDRCGQCGGEGYLPAGQATNLKGESYTRYQPCPMCEGTGETGRWLDLGEFATLLKQSTCPHEHVSTRGGFHFSAGDVWDDVEEVCSDCGKEMR